MTHCPNCAALESAYAQLAAELKKVEAIVNRAATEKARIEKENGTLREVVTEASLEMMRLRADLAEARNAIREMAQALGA